MRLSPGIILAALVAVVPLAAGHAQSLQTSGSAAGGVPVQPRNTMMPHRAAATRPTNSAGSGAMPESAAAQDRELDSIGAKLLRETPKNAPADSTSTGGGTVAPH